jgi:hypothetical protein
MEVELPATQTTSYQKMAAIPAIKTQWLLLSNALRSRNINGELSKKQYPNAYSVKNSERITIDANRRLTPVNKSRWQ